MLADSKTEISAQRQTIQDQVAQLEAMGRLNGELAEELELLKVMKAYEIPKEDQAVQTDAPSAAPVSKEEQLAFQQLRPVLGLEIAKEQTQGKGLHIIMVKANGTAAAAGLLEDEYLHAIQDGEEGMVPLTSSAVFEKIVKSTVPGDTLKAEVYASLPSDDLAGSHDADEHVQMERSFSQLPPCRHHDRSQRQVDGGNHGAPKEDCRRRGSRRGSLAKTDACAPKVVPAKRQVHNRKSQCNVKIATPKGTAWRWCKRPH